MQYYIALCTIELNTPFFTIQRLYIYTYKLMYSSLHRVAVILIWCFILTGSTQRNKVALSENEKCMLVLSVASLVIVSRLLMMILILT